MGAFTDDEYNYGLNLLKAKAHRPEQNAANEQRADAMGIPLGVAELDDNADTATARDWAKTDEERKAITKVMAASPEAARIGWMDRTFGKYAVKVASLLSSPQANPQNEAAIAEKYALTGAMVGELRHERSLIESTMSPSSEENDRLEGEYLMQEGSSERMQSLKDALARPFSESRSIANRAGFGASSGITRDYLDGIYEELGITPDNKGEYVAANKVATRALASDASAMMLLNELYGERWKELPDGHIGMLLSDIEKRTGIDLSLSNPSRMKAITRINPAEAANLFGIPELLWRSVTDPGNEDTRNKYNLGFPFALAEQADAQRGRTWIDRQANGLAHSLRFMGQHAITNFLTGGASAFANAGLLGKAGIALGESALLTTADTQGLSDTADTLRSRDMSYLDRDGNVVTVTPEKRDEMADLFVRSFASNFIENGSEWLGEFLPKMGGVSPFRRFYNKMVGRTPMKDALADFGANTLYNGLFGEMFEEVASKAAKGAMTELSEKYDIKQIDLGEDLKFDGAWFRDTFIQIAAQQAIMFGTGASAQKALNAMHRDDVSVFSLRQNATEVSDLMRGDTSFGGANITDAQRLVHLKEMKIGGQRLTLKLSDAAELMKRNPDACKALGITEESIGEAAKAGRSSMDLSVADFIAYRGGSANDVKFADEVMDATVGSGNVIAVTKRGATMREVEDALSESAESYRAREAAKRMVAEEIGRAVRENPNMAVNVELVASAAGGIIDYLSREGGMDISDFVERFKVLVSERPAELMSASSIQSLVPEDVRTLMDRKSDANVKLVDALARRFGVGDVVWATEDDLQEEQKASGVDAALINGWYVARNGETGKDEIHIAPSAAVRFTFGHELFHRIQAVSPEIAGEIHSILSDNGMLSGVLQRKMNAIRDAYSSVNGSVSEDEFSADMLGYVMNDLRFAQALARRLEEKSSGAGEKFLQAAIEAVDVVLSHLARLGSRSYQAEFLFNDYARKKELLTNLLVDFSERFGGVQPDVSTAENRKSKKSSKGRKYSIGNNENFRRWFGDSKVVDENGEPLVVYHGTEYGWFTAFDKSMARSEPGIWLTSSKALADEYAEDGRILASLDSQEYAIRNDTKGTNGETQFSVVQINGEYVAVADGYVLTTEESKDLEKVSEILASLVGQHFPQIGEETKVQFTDKSAKEFLWSGDSSGLRRKFGKLWRAKVSSIPIIGEILETTPLGTKELPKHINKHFKENAVFYRCPAKFGIERYDGIAVYQCQIVIVENRTSEQRYLYDIVGINKPTLSAKAFNRKAGAPAMGTDRTGESANADNIPQSANPEADDLKFSITPKAKAEELERGEKATVYRAMLEMDGKLYPPMATIVDGKMVPPVEMGRWYTSDAMSGDDIARMVSEKKMRWNSKGDLEFRLVKGDGGTDVWAAYNPYWHTSNMMLNDQFSSAYKRNLVVVRCEVPVSEGGAKFRHEHAKNATGWTGWHSGQVASWLANAGAATRDVFLSRYVKVVEKVSDEDVARSVAELVKGTSIQIPSNVVSAGLRAELEKAGVPIFETIGEDGGFDTEEFTKFKNSFAENRKSKKSSKGRKYSIGGLYTGTPHDYARKDENGNISNPPSLNSIGRGEGAYVYGYGLYATDNREIAEWYARSVGERHSEKVIKFDGKSYSDRIYEDRESLANDIKKKVEEIYANRFGKEKLEKRKKDKDSWLSDSLYHEIAVDRLFEDFKGSFDSANTSLFNYSWAYALNMVKDLLDYEVKTPDKYIYEQTFFNDGSGIVDWYSVASEEDVERIKSSIIPTFVNEGADDEAKDFIEDNFYVDIKQGDTYGEIYNKISEFIDEEMIDYEYVYKDKSKFATDVFLTSGIYGVRYPAKSRNGIKDGNEVGWNYVTFKDDNIEVNHKWRNGEKIYSIQTPADNSLANNQASFVELVSNADSIDAIREIAVWAYGMARSMVDNGMDQRGRIATSLAIIDEWLESDALKNPYEHGTFQHDEYKRRRFGDAFVRYVAESNPSAMADGIVKDAMRELKKIAKSAYASVASAIPRVPSAVSAVFGSMVDADSTIDDSTDFRLMANLLRSEAAKGYLGTGQSMLYDLVRKAEEKAKDVQSAKIQEILKVLRRQWEQEASDVADGMGRYRAEAEIAGAGGFTPKIADLAGYATEEGSDDAKAVRYGLDARKLVSKDSSMTLDDALSIASKNGYDDIETMVRDIVDNPTRQEYVAQFADSAQDAWLKAASFDADEEAIANDYAITALEQLEETLSSRLGAQKAFGKVAMQGIQQNRILKSTVSDVRGNSMVADTRVKIGELVEILGRKNVDDRKVLEKIGDIRANMEYLRQVGAEKALIDRNVAMMKKAFSAKKGVIQGEYQDAIMELGNFFGITSRKYVPGSLAKIMDVLKGQEDDENCFEDRTDIDTFFTDLTDILRRNEGLDWHRMTTADFDRVADAIRYLEYLGRGEVKDAKRGFWGKVRDQVDYFVREIGTDGKYTDYSDKTAIESAASVWRRGVSSTYNMNFMLGRTGRVGKEFVVEWVSKPSTRELGLMQDVYGEIRPLMSEFASEFAKVQKMVDDGRIYLEHDGSRYRRISDYLDAILPINNHKNGDYQGYKKWCNDGDDRSTASHMMMMALYLGTESGRQRIMDGYALRAPQDAIEADDSELSGIFQPFLSLFTGRQLEIINSIWDAIARGSLTDEVAKAYGEVNHSVFRTIPASPFIVARSVDGRTNVEMRGGYIPLNYLYHDRNSAKANESSAYATPDFKTTSSVNRRSDVIRDTYPLSLEDNVLFQHVRDSAHYATHRVPMSFAFKVIGDSDFKAAYTKRYSAEDYKALVKAFRRVSCPMTKERTAFTWIENAARYITIARAFIGNIPVALMQATSITVGATELGGYLNRAIMRYMQSPIDDVRRARELSPLMRERAKMQDVDMRRAYERMHGTKFENFRTSVLEIGTLPMHFMDNIVAVIQFNAAYDKAIDEGMSSLDAVAYAENFVASTQGAARQMDMTGFQDDTRFLSLFMSATSAMYNRTLLDFSTESGFRKYVSLACNQMIPMMSAMVVRYIANGGWMSGDGDDEWYETPASRAAIREMLTSPFSGIPYANIISDVVAEMAINGRIKEDAFSIPSLGIVTDSTRSIIKALKASRDDDADFAIYNFAKAVSDMAGIPVVTAHERIVKMLKSWNIDEINDAIEPIDLKEGLDDSK